MTATNQKGLSPLPALLYLKNIYFGDWSLLAPHELFSLSQKPQELGEICLTKACKKLYKTSNKNNPYNWT